MGVAPARSSLQPAPPQALPAPPSLLPARSELPGHAHPLPAGIANVVALDFSPRSPPGLPLRIQRDTRVSAPGDAAEIEAEQIARQVMAMTTPSAAAPPAPTAGNVPLRTTVATIQRRAVAPVTASAGTVSAIEGARGGGAPLPTPVRHFMEPRFGADFSDVRVHTGPQAATLSTALGANAFTHGREIWFNSGQYQPDTGAGRELIAHELAHTIQQGGTIQRSASAAPVNQRSQVIHRSIWDDIKSGVAGVVNALGDPLQFLANKANMIPGFRMFTIVLGTNPITMSPVAASPANILMALIEFIPGGGLVTQALQNSGVFDKVGAWIADKVKGLGQAAAAIKAAVTSFVGSLSIKDVADPGGVWDRAKRIFTEPIDQIIAFCKGVITDILKFIKDAILIPLARLAEGTDAWPLLTAVLGRNPITDEKVDAKPDVLIGGFMKLIGQEEVWKNMQEAKAVDRAFAWFKGAMSAVIGFVSAIPSKFGELFKALTIEDVVLVAGAFRKVAGVFGGFVGNFISWGMTAVFNLLEIVFDVVSPGAFAYVKKTAAALKGILKNPLPFVRNLIAAGKLGLGNFLGNFVTHLKSSLIEWLLGSVPGVYLPTALSLVEFGKFTVSILGLSWAQIRGKIVKALGKNGETIMKGLELAFDVIKLLVTGGLPALWNFIKEKLTNLKDMAVEAIVGFVKSAIIEKAIPKLIAMFIPGAGFIGAIVSIWDTIKVVVDKLATIGAVVKGYVDSIVAIAQGEIGGAAAKIESGFQSMLTLAISFFAGFVGLGGIPGKIKGAIEKLRETIDKGLDFAVNWVVGKAKGLFASLFGGGKDAKPDTRTVAEKDAAKQAALKEADALVPETDFQEDKVRGALAPIKARYKLLSLDLVVESKDDKVEKFHFVATASPGVSSKTRVVPVVAAGTVVTLASGAWVKKVGADEYAQVTAGAPVIKRNAAGDQPVNFTAVWAKSGASVTLSYAKEHTDWERTTYKHASKLVDLAGGGKFALKPQFSGGKYIRPNFYGAHDKAAIIAALRPKLVDPANPGFFKSQGDPSEEAGQGYTQKAADGSALVPLASASPDHRPPVAVHWNTTGSNADQSLRKTYNSNMGTFRLLSLKLNTALGSGETMDDDNIRYQPEVGANFRGPGE